MTMIEKLTTEDLLYDARENNKKLKQEINKNKQALEEIKKTILNYKSKEWNCFNDMDAKLEKISEILDEVLNDRS